MAALALRQRHTILERNLNLIRQNLELVNGFFARHEHLFDWTPPPAGPIAFPALKNGASSESFCRELVDAAGVLLLPGTTYGEFQSHFRIGASGGPACPNASGSSQSNSDPYTSITTNRTRR